MIATNPRFVCSLRSRATVNSQILQYYRDADQLLGQLDWKKAQNSKFSVSRPISAEALLLFAPWQTTIGTAFLTRRRAIMAIDDDVRVLGDRSRALEARIRVLEDILAGQTITLEAAGNSITIGPQGVVINSGSHIVLNSGSNLSINVTSDYSLRAQRNAVVQTGGDYAVTVGRSAPLLVGGSYTLNVGGSSSVSVSGNMGTRVGGGASTATGRDFAVTSGTDVLLTAHRNTKLDVWPAPGLDDTCLS
jgi:hypothetical protein